MEANKQFTVEKVNYRLFIMNNGLLTPAGGCLQLVNTDIQTISENYITNIELNKIDGRIYKYQIVVTGLSRILYNTHMQFTDETDDVYNLSLHLPMNKTHYLDYNSENPNIKKITFRWSLGDFLFPFF